MGTTKKTLGILLVVYFAGLLWSGISPHDHFTWILEVFPAILGLFALLLTYKRFEFTTLTYIFILVHCYILFVGGHYTYAEVPLFDWIRETFHQARNNYDKVGHFAQGFIPALIVREILVRGRVIQKNGWLPFLVVTVCLSISVFYEFLEWFVAIASGQSADAFLGTQGYVWDTQSDMMMAFIGSVSMLLLLGKMQDRQIDQLRVHGVE